MTAKYTRANGYEADCDVIYGDTDSVMVHFRARARTRPLAGLQRRGLAWDRATSMDIQARSSLSLSASYEVVCWDSC